MSTQRLWAALGCGTAAALTAMLGIYLWATASREATQAFLETTPERGPAYLAFAACALAALSAVIVLATGRPTDQR